ncbi:hypothetical protein EAI_08263 [Harpegnathos saltator]|uniref:THAP-type domain-containing protein n=1 Tax=Harpegnathos saltator TaxID=610380 RepID=E2BGF0_HARSA|nr:hypothetical protein EAI_08263 [Harpegnathos saltator]
MVWKCCVPQCTSKTAIPVHRFPMDRCRAEHWLTIIGKTELIGAPKEVLAKLRICTEHFSEEMVLPYGPIRRLNDNAVPSLKLNSCYVEQNVPVINNLEDHVHLIENVPNISNFVPVPMNMGEDVDILRNTNNKGLKRK